ncbi:MAG: hypothetical protein GY777_19970 [Candidatus Brocadiaceae bacterium]|nr:hypothetical protein [Candidatus Brocadiaceae bacterium]
MGEVKWRCVGEGVDGCGGNGVDGCGGNGVDGCGGNSDSMWWCGLMVSARKCG